VLPTVPGRLSGMVRERLPVAALRPEDVHIHGTYFANRFPMNTSTSLRRFLGRILLVFAVFPAMTASGQGNTAPAPHIPYDLDSVITRYTSLVDPARIQDAMESMEQMGTRFALAPNRRQVARWIRDQFVSYGYYNARLDSFYLSYTFRNQSYQQWQYNVIATLTGYQRPDSVYVMGAHYDSVVSAPDDPFAEAPGADDNASGVAAALEVARILKAEGYQPRYTIQFMAYGAEELGLHGSRYQAARAAPRGETVAMMLNNDMISHTDRSPQQWAIQLQYYDGSDHVTNLAREITSRYTDLQHVLSNSVVRYSDSQAYYEQGYPAIFFYEDRRTPFYHTPRDVVDNTNPEYAAQVTRISMGMLVQQNGYGDPDYISTRVPLLAGGSQARIHAYGQNLYLSLGSDLPDRQLQVYDAIGRLVLEQELGPGSDHQLGFPVNPGVYIVRVAGGVEHLVRKVVVQ